MRDICLPLLITTATTVASVVSGNKLDLLLLGWFAALLLVFITAYFTNYDFEQYILSLSWYGILLLGYLIPLPWGVVIVIASLAFGCCLSACIVRGSFTSTDLSPLLYVLKRLLGKLEPRQEVKQPKKGLQESTEVIYGPRQVLVPRHLAVRMRQGNLYTRTVGPGTHFTVGHEYIEQVYNLRPVHCTYRLPKVLTADGYTVDLSIVATYSINIDERSRLGEQSLTKSDLFNIEQLDRWSLDWEVVVQKVVERNTRLIIATQLFDNLMNAERQQGIENKISADIHTELQRWGLKLHWSKLLLIQQH
ncbi:MAG: hypothetical protein DYG89_42865 [Caldilinea sp. CFX5]|nr:hypothetical protein [Caldilinea sp. CFX5]